MTKKHEDEREEIQATRKGSADTPEPAPDCDDLDAVMARIAKARRALSEAEAAFQSAAGRDAERSGPMPGWSVGEIVENTSEFARRHPKFGLLAAGAVGFLIGRVTRR